MLTITLRNVALALRRPYLGAIATAGKQRHRHIDSDVVVVGAIKGGVLEPKVTGLVLQDQGYPRHVSTPADGDNLLCHLQGQRTCFNAFVVGGSALQPFLQRALQRNDSYLLRQPIQTADSETRVGKQGFAGNSKVGFGNHQLGLYCRLLCLAVVEIGNPCQLQVIQTLDLCQLVGNGFQFRFDGG